MKRILFILVLVLITTGVAESQKKGASIAVEGKAIYDFGKIKISDGAVTHKFKIKNEGESTLVLTRATTSCQCTTAKISKEPIAPGSNTGEVEVTFDPKGNAAAPFTKTINIYSNGKTGTFILTIKGEIIE